MKLDMKLVDIGIAAVHNVHKSKFSCDWQLRNLCQERCLAPEYHLSMQKLHNNGASFTPRESKLSLFFALRAVVSPLFAFACRSTKKKKPIRNIGVIHFCPAQVRQQKLVTLYAVN